MTSDDLSDASRPVSVLPSGWQDEIDAEQMGEVVLALLKGIRALMVPLARALEEALRRPEVQARLRRAERVIWESHRSIMAVEAPGYVPYFQRLGYDGLTARVHVLMLRSCAERFYRESQDRRVALSALHDLARRPRWHPALIRQVGALQDNAWDANFLDEACRGAGSPALKGELLSLLGRTRGGDHSGGLRIIAIAKRIIPYAPSPRGRSVAYDTVLHQTFLRWSAEFGGRHGYTYGLSRDGKTSREDFLDEATAATRFELRHPFFNPVSARRAERKRMARKPANGTAEGA